MINRAINVEKVDWPVDVRIHSGFKTYTNQYIVHVCMA